MTNKREHIDIENEDSTFWKQYNLIRKMREEEDGVAFNAPVDTVGCAHLGTPPDETLAPDVVEQQRKTFRFQTLLALMLSSQTKDGIVALAMGKLKNHGCTVDNIAETTSETLAKLIHPVGFYKV
jgi:endonuclease-3